MNAHVDPLANAIEQIKAYGIAEARREHHRRRALLTKLAECSMLRDGYFGMMRRVSLLSMDDAIQFHRAIVRQQQAKKRADMWSYDQGRHRAAAERWVFARFFRRYGLRIVMAQRVAELMPADISHQQAKEAV